MLAPENIVLIDLGDQVTWCDSVPSDDIDDDDVVNYIRENIHFKQLAEKDKEIAKWKQIAEDAAVCNDKVEAMALVDNALQGKEDK